MAGFWRKIVILKRLSKAMKKELLCLSGPMYMIYGTPI
jgi:hypothetical protein